MDERNERESKNTHDTRRVPLVREGVGYTPSDSVDDFDYDFDPDATASGGYDMDEDIARTRKISTPPQARPARRQEDNTTKIPQSQPRRTPQRQDAPPQKMRKAPKKAHYAIFLVTTVFISVIAMVFVFAMMFNSWNEDGGHFSGGDSQTNQTTQGSSSNNTEPEEQVYQPELVLAPGSISIIGLVQEISLVSRRIDIYMLEDSQLRSFFVEDSSVLRDRFGDLITFSDFRVGDVVEIAHEEGHTVVQTARVSAQVIVFRNIRDVLVDLETNEVQIGNNRYSFGSRTIVMYHDEPNRMADVDAVDIVTVNIFQDQVVFIDIHQGNGIIRIPDNDAILQGTVEVAGTTFAALDGEMEIRVPEGDHRVVIRGQNIEIFEYELTVARGGSATVDFEGLELLTGSLTVNVADPYVDLRIDGEIQLTNTMLTLEFGIHTVSVTRNGFVPFEQEVTIDSANHEITVVLEEIIRTQNVTLTTSPPGARMYLDGQFVGLSPVSMELELRRHTVTMALEGFVGGASDIWVTEDQYIYSWWLQSDPNFMGTPMPTPTPPPPADPNPTPTPPPPLYPDVSPSPSPSPFFP